MKITMTCDGLNEQLMLFDLLDISSILPGNYRLINNAGDVEPNEPVKREIEIDIDVNDELDRKSSAKILNFWAIHWDTKCAANDSQ